MKSKMECSTGPKNDDLSQRKINKETKNITKHFCLCLQKPVSTVKRKSSEPHVMQTRLSSWSQLCTEGWSWDDVLSGNIIGSYITQKPYAQMRHSTWLSWMIRYTKHIYISFTTILDWKYWPLWTTFQTIIEIHLRHLRFCHILFSRQIEDCDWSILRPCLQIWPMSVVLIVKQFM